MTHVLLPTSSVKVPVKESDKMGESIQEWTKKIFWKTAFKNLKGYGLHKQIHTTYMGN